MQWIQVQVQDDPGSTYVAQLPNGVLVRTQSIGGGGHGPSECLSYIPGLQVEHFTVPQPGPPPLAHEQVDPGKMSGADKALFDMVAAEEPEVASLTHAQFELLKIAVSVAGPGS